MYKIYKVSNDYINARIDKWFKKNINLVPQSLIEKNLRKGKIKVNNEKVKSSYKLKQDDEIILFDINFFKNINKKVKFQYTATKKDIVYSSKIFIENNENFVIINKPAGIAVQSGTKSKRNIIDILKSTKEFGGTNPYTVHRIDKETSGVLIVAKNRKYAQLFTSLFRIRKIYKSYLGVVVGELKNKKGTLVDILYHYEKDKKIKTKAITHFNVLDSNSYYSLLKLNPETGRKHQLRKQLLIHGFPILGDSKYRFTENKSKRSDLMLHAHNISFSINGKKYSYTADPPLYFNNILKEKYLKIF